MSGRQLAAHAAILLVLACAGVEAALAPSLSPPGDLEPSNTPMFILFTHDDAVLSSTHELMRGVTDGRTSQDGCPAVATMFTLVAGNDCDLMMDLYNSGYEIADHTETHHSLKGMSNSKLTYEIVGARASLAECGVPESEIVGLRAPYLETDIDVRKKMFENGFLYESSLIEVNNGASLSQGEGQRVWPFTMDAGVPIDCSYFAGTEECSTSERWPGMWQVPVWWLTNGGTDGTPYSMDYGDAYATLKENFDAAYEGNRAPLPIYIHTPWLQDGNNLDELKEFADYALSKPNVYFVSMRQLIGWMQNPIGADELTPEALGCGLPGGAPGTGASNTTTPAPTPAPTPLVSTPISTPTATPSTSVEKANSGSNGGSDSSGVISYIDARLAALSGRRLLK